MTTESAPSSELKLSLPAMFDDMVRAQSSLDHQQNADDKVWLNFLAQTEKNWLRWKMDRQKLASQELKIGELSQEVEKLKVELQRIRQAFAFEVKQKEEMKRKYEKDHNVVESLRNLLSRVTESDTDSSSLPSRIESMLEEANKTPAKQKGRFSGDSLGDQSDELLFDTSEDSIDELDERVRRIVSEAVSPPKKMKCSTIEEESTVQESHSSASVINTAFVAINAFEPEKKETKVKDDQPLKDEPLKPVAPKPSTSSCSLGSSTRPPVTLPNRYYSRTSLHRNMELEPSRLDTRSHTFHPKKAFSRATCVPCNKVISFCTTYLVCVDCRGVTHQACKDKLPRPCIPHVSSSAVYKMSSLKPSSSSNILMIHHFIQDGHRPCVPAILIHCCNEIDRRIEAVLKGQLSDSKNSSSLSGIYRLSGTDRVVREWRSKILEAKKGIPNLASLNDVNVICGVVKLFLRDLYEPLVTTVLWVDFVRAADHVEENALKLQSMDPKNDSNYSIGLDANNNNEEYLYSIRVLKRVILQLPPANKDTMAFLFVHFGHVIESHSVTKMDAKSLSRIFGPILVGVDRPRLLSVNTTSKETEQQNMVMSSLFRLESNFWNGVLHDSQFDPFKDETIKNRPSLDGSALEVRQKSSSNLVAGGGKPKPTDLMFAALY